MASDQYRSLSPEAVLATLRSLPRRYRAELFADPAIDVTSTAAGIADAAARITALADAVHQAAVLDHPSLSVDVAPVGTPRSVDEALAALDAAVAHAAELIDELPTSAWSRTASLKGAQHTVLELAQDCARAGAEYLRQLTAQLNQQKPDRDR